MMEREAVIISSREKKLAREENHDIMLPCNIEIKFV